jgi:osmotically-inducible protein OsmY
MYKRGGGLMLAKKIILYYLLLFIVIINSVSYASENTHNQHLYTEVIEKLNFEPKLNSSDITVRIRGEGDVVVLGGTVKSYIEKSIAETAVKKIKGVKAVIDEIIVDSSSWKERRSDAAITSAAIQAFKWHILIPSETIQIVVDKGNVILSGKVDWQFQKELAWNTVSSLVGVKSIMNNIVVKPSVNLDSSKVKENITKEFERHARLDASKIHIETHGKKIILKGEVRNFDEMDYAKAAAWSIPGVNEVENKLIIRHD